MYVLKSSLKPSNFQSPQRDSRIDKKLSFGQMRPSPRNHSGSNLDRARLSMLITVGELTKKSPMMRQKSDINLNQNLEKVLGSKKSNTAYLDVRSNGIQTQPIPASYFSENHRGNLTDRARRQNLKKKPSFTLPLETLLTPGMDPSNLRPQGSVMPKSRLSWRSSTQRKVDFSQLNENNIPKFLKSSQNMTEK
jgi:hypothetical protein